MYKCSYWLKSLLVVCKVFPNITAQKTKFSIDDFFSKCDQIRRKLENFIFFLQCIKWRSFRKIIFLFSCLTLYLIKKAIYLLSPFKLCGSNIKETTLFTTAKNTLFPPNFHSYSFRIVSAIRWNYAETVPLHKFSIPGN